MSNKTEEGKLVESWITGTPRDIDPNALRRLVLACSQQSHQLTTKEDRSSKDEAAIVLLNVAQVQQELRLATTLILQRLEQMEERLRKLEGTA